MTLVTTGDYMLSTCDDNIVDPCDNTDDLQALHFGCDS